MQYGKSLILILYQDKSLLISIIIVTILTLSNVLNKVLFGFEPLQYSLFSYDKILHLLCSLIILRIIYWNYSLARPEDPSKKKILLSSLLTIILYGLLWEVFELFTFYIQGSEQAWQELLDIPLDWLYDIAGILVSNFLGYSMK